MILLQLLLFCALFTLMVKIAVSSSPLKGLFFYPKPVQERAYALGLTDREKVSRKRRRFMIPFFLVMAAALVLIVGLWNGICTFWPAYWQALLFLEVMNWYDGVVIDQLWVGHSRFWIIPGTEDIPLRPDLAPGAEEARHPDADLALWRGHRGRDRCALVLKGWMQGDDR